MVSLIIVFVMIVLRSVLHSVIEFSQKFLTFFPIVKRNCSVLQKM